MKPLLIITLSVIAISAILLDACTSNDPVKQADELNKQTSDSMSKAMLNNDDSRFATAAASGGIMEVELGKICAEKGMTDQARNFGKMMVDDHTNINNDLMGLAAAKNLALPSSMSTKDQQMVNDLKKKSGTDFDKAYISMMVNDHKEDISDFKKESTEGKDPEISAFASRTLPTLQRHLDAANVAQDAITGK